MVRSYLQAIKVLLASGPVGQVNERELGFCTSSRRAPNVYPSLPPTRLGVIATRLPHSDASHAVVNIERKCHQGRRGAACNHVCNADDWPRRCVDDYESKFKNITADVRDLKLRRIASSVTTWPQPACPPFTVCDSGDAPAESTIDSAILHRKTGTQALCNHRATDERSSILADFLEGDGQGLTHVRQHGLNQVLDLAGRFRMLLRQPLGLCNWMSGLLLDAIFLPWTTATHSRYTSDSENVVVVFDVSTMPILRYTSLPGRSPSFASRSSQLQPLRHQSVWPRDRVIAVFHDALLPTQPTP
ncbi:hypothetical protein CkaCkLH20_12617 [Colletotrichum karsti]|uniref:Uncharacterized protein n=1 Tax=Colletotrichum karsti TaxID=1095194 RepID=A0A9P6LEV4_9PEZI|nr:uncharacterized protein CkaCkLH20_12617 [Colletotrichum karsti]KAF9869910.1 hypothetical protein CkaCkLH20_12617 [Colletotrichum karsti]